MPVSAEAEDRRELELAVPLPAFGRMADFLVQSGLVPGGAAVLALLAFVFAWQMFLPFSLALAVAVFFGVAMLVPAADPDRIIVDGLTDSELQRVLAEGAARVALIERDKERIPKPATRLLVYGIARTANRIIADFRERPRHVSEARFVFDALLDATVMAMDRYLKFWRVSGPAAQRGREILEVRVFPTIDRGFQQLLEKLLQDDLRALDIDVAVLEQLLDLEGLSAGRRTQQERSAGDADAKRIETSGPTIVPDGAPHEKERNSHDG